MELSEPYFRGKVFFLVKGQLDADAYGDPWGWRKEVSQMARWRKTAGHIKTENQMEELKGEFRGLAAHAEHFLEANRVALVILGELIPKAEDDTLRARLEVVVDVLYGANERYTE